MTTRNWKNLVGDFASAAAEFVGRHKSAVAATLALAGVAMSGVAEAKEPSVYFSHYVKSAVAQQLHIKGATSGDALVTFKRGPHQYVRFIFGPNGNLVAQDPWASGVETEKATYIANNDSRIKLAKAKAVVVEARSSAASSTIIAGANVARGPADSAERIATAAKTREVTVTSTAAANDDAAPVDTSWISALRSANVAMALPPQAQASDETWHQLFMDVASYRGLVEKTTGPAAASGSTTFGVLSTNWVDPSSVGLRDDKGRATDGMTAEQLLALKMRGAKVEVREPA
jgi:hypothetical protein